MRNLGVKVWVRHGGNTYTGSRASLAEGQDLSHRGSLQTAEGAFRLIASEIINPQPKPGDEIEVAFAAAGPWKSRFVQNGTRPDPSGATIYVPYGAQYA